MLHSACRVGDARVMVGVCWRYLSRPGQTCHASHACVTIYDCWSVGGGDVISPGTSRHVQRKEQIFDGLLRQVPSSKTSGTPERLVGVCAMNCSHVLNAQAHATILSPAIW